MGMHQGELSWDQSSAGADGHASWMEQRRAALAAAGKALGLPLGHEVDLELRDGCRMRGVLRLAEDGLFVDVTRDKPPLLRVDRCTFGLGDMVSCVKVEGPTVTSRSGPGSAG